MKSITRYASVLSACSILAGTALLADNANVPRSDNTAGTSGSTNSTTTSGADSSMSSGSAASSSDTTGGAATPRASNTAGTSGSSNNTAPSGSTANSPSMSSSDSTSTGGAATPRSDNTMGTSGSSNSTSPSMSNSAVNNGSMATPSVGAMGLNDPLSSSLQSADYANRTQVANDVEQRLDSQKETLKSIKKEGHHLDGQAKSDFKAAWDDVEAREKDLKHSLHQVRNASQDQWDTSRSQLASNYQAFETAMSRLQTQVSGAATSGTSSNSMMSK